MLDGTDLYALDIDGASFVKACGGPCTEGCVTLARIGDDAWARQQAAGRAAAAVHHGGTGRGRDRPGAIRSERLTLLPGQPARPPLHTSRAGWWRNPHHRTGIDWCTTITAICGSARENASTRKPYGGPRTPSRHRPEAGPN